MNILHVHVHVLLLFFSKLSVDSILFIIFRLEKEYLLKKEKQATENSNIIVSYLWVWFPLLVDTPT